MVVAYLGQDQVDLLYVPLEFRKIPEFNHKNGIWAFKAETRFHIYSQALQLIKPSTHSQ